MRPSIGIVCMATGKYLDYWFELARSISRSPNLPENVRLYVLTDRITEAILFATKCGIKVSVLDVPSSSFPDASINRYFEVLKLLRSQIIDGDTLVFCDADMLFHDFPPFSSLVSEGRVSFVAHPGFWRSRSPISRLLLYLSGNHMFKDVYYRLRFGGRGTWETRRRSSARVNRQNRETYICGGIWFAGRENFEFVCDQVVRSMREDSNNGFIARWHDESHLNAVYANFGGTVLPPNFCFARGYQNLRDLIPIIEAVDKNVEL